MTKILASYGISWNLQNEVQEPKIDSFIKDVLTIKGCDGWWQYDDSRSQELLERKIKNAPEGQGSVRMLTREEWDEFREVRPRTPFESTLARPNSRIRTGEPLRLVIACASLYALFSLYACRDCIR